MNIKKDKLKLISQTLYRAYSLPYTRKNNSTIKDITYEQTYEEKDMCRRISLIIDRIIKKRELSYQKWRKNKIK